MKVGKTESVTHTEVDNLSEDSKQKQICTVEKTDKPRLIIPQIKRKRNDSSLEESERKRWRETSRPKGKAVKRGIKSEYYTTPGAILSNDPKEMCRVICHLCGFEGFKFNFLINHMQVMHPEVISQNNKLIKF